MRPAPEGRISTSSPRRDGELLDDGAGMLVVDVDDGFLDRLQLLAVGAVAEDDARLADGELEALAAHRLDQDAELQLAAAGDLEGVLVVALGDASARRCPPPRAAGGRG